jgi:hypothetical protein
LGAAAYDSYDDLVVVYGGFQEGSVFPVYDGTDSSVTNPSGRSFTSDVLEYTPPSTQTDEGAWTSVPVCAGSSAPTVRYGHSLSYDIKNQQLVVVGGYNAITGVPLTNSITAVNGTYNIPDVWTAKRNTSGGLGNYCYDWTQVSTFGNNATGVPNLADGLANFSALYVPNQGYGTGYYSMFDSSCIGSGPIDSPDPLQNKLYAGGVYFDIDRTQLGTYENLILNLTFLPLGPTNQSPTINTMTSADTAVFQVDLVTTGQSNSALEAVLQPRFLTYTDNNEFPTVVQTLSVLAPPTGQIRQEQMLIPLSVNPSIDRIHIKRVSGSGILIDASLFRLGAGEN